MLMQTEVKTVPESWERSSDSVRVRNWVVS